jgi:hypothetical protein
MSQNSNLHVGHHIVQTITGIGGAALPPGAVSVAVAPAGIVTASIDPTTNAVTLTGVAPGTANATYSAAGYSSVVDTVLVSAAPPLLVVDGPEV